MTVPAPLPVIATVSTIDAASLTAPSSTSGYQPPICPSPVKGGSDLVQSQPRNTILPAPKGMMTTEAFVPSS